MKERLDILLVKQGLFPSRERARKAIAAGQVTVNGSKVWKAGTFLDSASASIKVLGDPLPFVSRGGLKLAHAVASFSLDLKDKICLDIGASTGGFTDCMLQNGADRVYAVDVGYGQLAETLRQDERVVVREKTNFRHMTPADLPECPDFAGADVSFISLTWILPAAFAILKAQSEMVCLVKPQFEAGREKVGKKGVVRDKATHQKVLADILRFSGTIGFTVCHLDYSPIKGPEGNIEYLLHLQKGSVVQGMTEADIAAVVAQAHDFYR